MSHLLGTTPFISKPLSNVTPFTYRDGETYLEQLKRLRDWIDTVSDFLEGNIDVVSQNVDSKINTLITDFNTALAEINTALLAMEESGGMLIYDPTTGNLTGAATAIGHVYDNTRYYAYFADQLDAFENTAAEWEALDYTARHFDLALAYSPTTTQADNIVPSTVAPN